MNITYDTLSLLSQQIKKIGDWLYEESKEKSISYREKDHAPDNLLTDFDVKTQEAIVSAIHRLFPNASICAEEMARFQGSSPYTFYVDPIDGTTNFVRLGKDYAISIALYQKNVGIWSMIYTPFDQKSYEAWRGKGAYCNEKAIYTRGTTLRHVLWEGSYSTILSLQKKGFSVEKLHKACGGHRYAGAVSLGMLHVAQGDVGLFFSSKARAWDYAAGALLVEEAGGVLYPLSDTTFSFDDTPSPFLAAATPSLLQEALAYLT